MDGPRSAKRRKLDVPSTLPARSSAAAQLAELRRSKSQRKGSPVKPTYRAQGNTSATTYGAALNGEAGEAGLDTRSGNSDQVNGNHGDDKGTRMTRTTRATLEAATANEAVEVTGSPSMQGLNDTASASSGRWARTGGGSNGLHKSSRRWIPSSEDEPGPELHNGVEATHDVVMEDAVLDDVETPNRRHTNGVHHDEENETPQPRASGRSRRQTLRFEESYSQSPAPPDKPKAVKTLEDEIKDIERQSSQPGGDQVETPRRTRRSGKDFVAGQASNGAEHEAVHRDETPTTSARKRIQRPAKQVGKSLRRRTQSLSVVSPGSEKVIASRHVSVVSQRSPTPDGPEIDCSDGIEVDKVAELAVVDGRIIEPEHAALFQRVVLEKLTSKRLAQVIGLDDEYAKIANLVQQTVVAGESNSMLIIGARGSGKTAVIDRILHNQRTRQQEDFLIVRLSGFIHTDDKIALREIWRQLGREMDLEDENLSRNYADTLTTLLALLSHPSELGAQDAGQVAKSVIFILDEFELFASHPRQTLLYNLFDIAQSRKAPIAVLGLTTRFDVAESLEKRVKSRFSHRQVHLPLAKTPALFSEICKSALLVHVEDVAHTAIGVHTSSPLNCVKDTLESQLDASRQAWNAAIESLYTSSEPFQHHLASIYYSTKSAPAFHASMLLPIGSIPSIPPSSTKSTQLTATALHTHLSTSTLSASVPTSSASSRLAPPDSKLTLLATLSTLQLALLIAAARLSIVLDTETCTFALVYDEYKTLASKARVQASAAGALATGTAARVWGKEVAAQAWEGLLAAQLVLPVHEGRGAGAGGAAREAAVCRVDVSLEEIGLSGLEMSAGMVRWCKEI